MANIIHEESGKLNLLDSIEKASPMGYYLSAYVIVVLLATYILIDYSVGIMQDSNVVAFITNELNILSILIFIITAIYGFRKSGNLKIHKGITALVASAAFFFMAEIVLAWHSMAAQRLYASLAELFYIPGIISVILAVYYLTSVVRIKKGTTLVILLMLAAPVVIIISMIVAEVFGINIAGQTIMLDILNPVLDVICLIMIVNLLTLSAGKSIVEAQAVLAAGILFMLVSDIYSSATNIMGFYYNGSLPDVLSPISYMLCAISVSRYVDLTRFDILIDRVSKINNK